MILTAAFFKNMSCELHLAYLKRLASLKWNLKIYNLERRFQYLLS